MAKKIIVIGGHGKVAQLATPLLVNEGYEVTSVIRNPHHVPDIEALGAKPELQDITELSVEQFTDVLSGHDAIIWSAGAGGGAPERTYAIDRDAAINSIAAAKKAGVNRYVMVSYFGAGPDHGVPEDHSFFAYAESKAAADAALRESGLDWTILGPSTLTDTDGRDSIDAEASEPAKVARATVANVIAHTVFNSGTEQRTINFNEGETPIPVALNPEL
ncbi:NAD(P)-binding oxidoreductase [Corynebacterium resistens]